MTDLVVFRRQFIQALLNDVIAVQVLNEHNNVETERDYDRMNLAMVSMISLRPTATLSVDRRKNNYELYLPVSLWTESRSFFEQPLSRAY
jgi:DNA-directed RNA polymerase alpha subunit